MILVEMLGHWVRVHLYVGELSCVSLKVDFEISLCREPAAADVALEGALTCVGPDMYLQGRVASENLAAVAAAVFEEWFIASSRLAVVGRQRARLAALAKSELVSQIVGQQSLARVV